MPSSTMGLRISWRSLAEAALFVPAYVALDWASYIYPLGPFNITPWDPQPALAIAWMTLRGLQNAPAVLATIVLADVIVRGAPGGYLVAALAAAVLAAGYTAIAAVLRGVLHSAELSSIRRLTIFAGTVIAGAGLAGLAYVGVLEGAELIEPSFFGDAALRFWIGDAVGILVTLPLLLAAADPARRGTLLLLARRAEPLLQALVLVGVLWLVFNGLRGDPAHHFYLLFLPLIWITVRSGMNGAVVATAIVQVGVLLGMHAEKQGSLTIFELQVLVAALSLTGLFLGVMVDERARSEERLRQTLRLAAAGEMAGAIAHEVNQPLTALANYGRSAQMLLRKPDARAEDLDQVIGKMIAEAGRAADVVRRLRDFFRAGTTRLEIIAVEDLLSLARQIGDAAIGGRAIDLRTEAPAGIPALFVDRLQIELILRNLIANAVESVSAHPARERRIVVAVERHDERQVRVAVIDNGPGVAAAVRERLFQPFVSGKPTGLGLGLAVSRAIAEGHGGSLEARAGERGEFHLLLPCVRT
ncbi:MAG TPA: MASE1 domain-containing protein [Burkholderiales bacterium]|nr:MASE1 domain-containing protein [Burkholderiales bacterium]